MVTHSDRFKMVGQSMVGASVNLNSLRQSVGSHEEGGFESATVDIADLENQTFTDDVGTKRGSEYDEKEEDAVRYE